MELNRIFSVAVALSVLGTFGWSESFAEPTAESLDWRPESPKVGGAGARPVGIELTDTDIQLVADFGAKRAKGEPVPVYLVNNTTRNLVLNAQDGDVYLKLERRNPQGDWERVQTQIWTICGNSFDYRPKLNRNSYLLLEGYEPSKGEVQEVRYSLYGQDFFVSSNAGRLKVAEVDRLAAICDRFTAESASFEEILLVAKGHPNGPCPWDKWVTVQMYGIDYLTHERFDSARSLKVLQKLQQEFPDLKDFIGERIAEVKARQEKK